MAANKMENMEKVERTEALRDEVEEELDDKLKRNREAELKIATTAGFVVGALSGYLVQIIGVRNTAILAFVAIFIRILIG